ncbi:type I toxin-antitoxin system toxin [Romboutsia ilealis]
MENFILSVLAGLVTSYITYLCSKIKNHLFNGRRKSGYEFEVKLKFKRY